MTNGVAPSRREALRVSSVVHPGWKVGDGRIPLVGEAVYCADGVAEVARLLGRTGDGSRLLELRLLHSPKTPYFAASSNVLSRDEGGSDVDGSSESRELSL